MGARLCPQGGRGLRRFAARRGAAGRTAATRSSPWRQQAPHPDCTAPINTHRGIGRGLVEKLLARDNTVIATARSAPAARSSLAPLLEAHPSKLLVSELEVSDERGIAAWAAALKGQHGVKHVDVSGRSCVHTCCV